MMNFAGHGRAACGPVSQMAPCISEGIVVFLRELVCFLRLPMGNDTVLQSRSSAAAV